jgi:hypothetical protein
MAITRALERHSIPFLVSWVFQLAFRVVTGRLRTLPDFVIIGGQRCGTTSLYNYLVEHPNVLPAFRKETHFFTNHFGKGVTWYRAHFPSGLYRSYAQRRYGQDFVSGEATPYYIFHPHAPRRMFETIPGVRLIVLLRNPIDRAYSHYHHEARAGLESLSFEDAIERELEELPRETEKMVRDEHYRSFDHQNYSYLARGIYVEQLESWGKFFDRQQMLIIQSEGFDQDPPAALRQVTEFLDLPAWELEEYTKYHQAHYAPMDPAIRKRLVELYQDHNHRLYEFLGRDFGWEG